MLLLLSFLAIASASLCSDQGGQCLKPSAECRDGSKVESDWWCGNTGDQCCMPESRLTKKVTDATSSLYTTWMLWCNKVDVWKWNTKWAKATVPMDVVAIVDANKGRAAVMLPTATDPDTILVAFRGVHSNGQWFQTAKFWRTDFYGVGVHDGFNDNYRALQEGVRAGVARALRRCPNCKKIHFTGYSMGGALAPLALVDINKQFRDENDKPKLCGSIITFGAPRVGNDEFATELFPNAVCGSSRRVVHKGDMVSFLPPRWTGFRHAAFEYWNPDTSPRTELTVIRNCDPDKYDGDNDRCSNEHGDTGIADHSKYLGLDFDKEGGCELHTQINGDGSRTNDLVSDAMGHEIDVDTESSSNMA